MRADRQVKAVRSAASAGAAFGRVMDIRRVDLNLLVALDVLLAERNVTRAAARLNLSQPATSSILHRLRDLFGDPLLIRTPDGMRPTPRALQLAAPLRKILGEMNELIQPQAFDPKVAEAAFSIATPDCVELALLPLMMETLRREGPGIKLTLREINFDLLSKQVSNGDIDLCITTKSKVPMLRADELYQDRAVWVVRKGHPVASQPLSLEALCRLDHVNLPGQMADEADRVLKATGHSRSIIVTVPHYFLVAEIVSRSDMVAMLPLSMASRYAKSLVWLESPVPILHFSVHLCWHESTDHHPGLRWLRELIVGVFREPNVSPKLRRA